MNGSDHRLPTPRGFASVIATFGDPKKYRRADGTLSDRWEQDKITRVVLPEPLPYVGGGTVTKIAVHYLLKDIAAATLAEIHTHSDLWAELAPYGGGFEPRLKRGSLQVSLHTFGIAFDFNPVKYPLGSSDRMPDDLVAIFKSHGWFYGGDFQDRKDPMHVQYAVGA